MNPNILRPGSNDGEIRDRLLEFVNANQPLIEVVDEYFEKVKEYPVKAPFPVLRRDIKQPQRGEFHMFSYRNKIFHGYIIGKILEGFLFRPSSLQQVMADGSLTRKRFNGTADIDVNDSEAWIDIHNPLYPNRFWDDVGRSAFHQRVPATAIVYERRFYSILKPFYQFIGLINDCLLYTSDAADE